MATEGLLTVTQAEKDKESILDRILSELVQSERIINGREQQTTMIIVDAKSVKNTDTACEKGFDAGKKNIRCETA